MDIWGPLHYYSQTVHSPVALACHRCIVGTGQPVDAACDLDGRLVVLLVHAPQKGHQVGAGRAQASQLVRQAGQQLVVLDPHQRMHISHCNTKRKAQTQMHIRFSNAMRPMALTAFRACLEPNLREEQIGIVHVIGGHVKQQSQHYGRNAFVPQVQLSAKVQHIFVVPRQRFAERSTHN